MDSTTNTQKQNELNLRQDKIISFLKAYGYQSICELSQKLGVSEQTIRRDLKKLEELGLLSKYHGGASINNKNNLSVDELFNNNTSSVNNIEFTNKDLSLREIAYVKEKKAIAKAVSDLIPDGSSVFITIGSTVEYIAKELVHKNNLLVITNSLRVANSLYPYPNIKVLIPSGVIKAFNGGIEGPNSLQDLEQFRADFFVSSIGAIDNDGTLLDYNYSEVVMAQLMMKNAKQAILACDKSKFESQAPVKLGNLSNVSALVTDQRPNNSIIDIWKAHNVDLIVVDD